MARIKLRKLEELLQMVADFERPKLSLEQYITPSHIASHMLYAVQTNFGDIESQCILDFGSGSGMLSIGASLLGAAHVLGIEVDADAIQIFHRNVREFEVANIDCVQWDVTMLSNLETPILFDIVLCNPPFGTKSNNGMDIIFLQSALKTATKAVYSLHKTSTREYIRNKAKEWNVKANVIAELKYNLPNTYKFHKRMSVDIAVDLWRITINKNEESDRND